MRKSTGDDSINVYQCKGATRLAGTTDERQDSIEAAAGSEPQHLVNELDSKVHSEEQGTVSALSTESRERTSCVSGTQNSDNNSEARLPTSNESDEESSFSSFSLPSDVLMGPGSDAITPGAFAIYPTINEANNDLNADVYPVISTAHPVPCDGLEYENDDISLEVDLIRHKQVFFIVVFVIVLALGLAVALAIPGLIKRNPDDYYHLGDNQYDKARIDHSGEQDGDEFTSDETTDKSNPISSENNIKWELFSHINGDEDAQIRRMYLSENGTSIAIQYPYFYGLHHIQVCDISSDQKENTCHIVLEEKVSNRVHLFSFSSGGDVLAVCFPESFDGDINNDGFIRIFRKDNSNGTWFNTGKDIHYMNDLNLKDENQPHEVEEEITVTSVSLSQNGQSLMFSTPKSNNYKGSVHIYTFDNTVDIWSHRFSLEGKKYLNSGLFFFGSSIVMSEDGSTLAIGSVSLGTGEHEYTTEEIQIFDLSYGSETTSGSDSDITISKYDTKFEREARVVFFPDDTLSISNNGRVIAIGSGGSGSTSSTPSLKTHIYSCDPTNNDPATNISSCTWKRTWNNMSADKLCLLGDGNRIAAVAREEEEEFIDNSYMYRMNLFEWDDQTRGWIQISKNEFLSYRTGSVPKLPVVIKSLSASRDGNNLAVLAFSGNTDQWINVYTFE